jgi:hypothetical protein
MRRIVALIGLLVFLPGCGSGGGAGSTSSTQSFAARADTICASFKARLKQVPKPKNPDNLGQVAVYLERTLPPSRQLTTDLAALTPDEKDAQTFAQFLGVLRDEIATVEQAQADAQAQNAVAMRKTFVQSQLATLKARRLGRRLGFTVCAQPSPTAQ